MWEAVSRLWRGRDSTKGMAGRGLSKDKACPAEQEGWCVYSSGSVCGVRWKLQYEESSEGVLDTSSKTTGLIKDQKMVLRDGRG
jgi:hypothetical protein